MKSLFFAIAPDEVASVTPVMPNEVKHLACE